jgi:hypothetical protein
VEEYVPSSLPLFLFLHWQDREREEYVWRNMYLQSCPSSSSYTGKIEKERNMCGGICTFNPAPLTLLTMVR